MEVIVDNNNTQIQMRISDTTCKLNGGYQDIRRFILFVIYGTSSSL